MSNSNNIPPTRVIRGNDTEGATRKLDVEVEVEKPAKPTMKIDSDTPLRGDKSVNVDISKDTHFNSAAKQKAQAPDVKSEGKSSKANPPKTTLYRPGAIVEAEATEPSEDTDAPVIGWLVIVDGPGKGKGFSFSYGDQSIGRGTENSLVLDFGDTGISREAHANVMYDPQVKEFYLTRGGNNVYHQGNRVPGNGEVNLQSGDNILLGGTTLKFVALCGKDFDWNDTL